MIVVDPAHGGTEPRGKSTPYGARGPGGTDEKDVVLHLAHLVASHLGPDRVRLTRDRDVPRSLGERAALARSTGSEVFLSLHTGAAGDVPRAWIHRRAGASSEALARSLLRELGPHGAVGRADLAVLDPDAVGPSAAVLLEVDGIDDLHGERRMTDGAHLDRLARGIAAAVAAHVGFVRQPPATTTAIRPWSDFFQFTAGTNFFVDGPAGYNGSGRVITNTATTVRFTLVMPAYSIFGNDIPALNADIEATYVREGAGNPGRIIVDGQTFDDPNLTITTVGNRRRVVPSISVPGANIGAIEAGNDGADEIDLDITVDGTVHDFDLERR